MRFIRLGAFLAWGAFASFAVAGFAAFNPVASAPDLPVPTTAAVVDRVVADDAGALAGRVAAVGFATTVSVAPSRPAETSDLLSASRATTATSATVPSVTVETTTSTTTEPTTPETTVASTSPTTTPPTTATTAAPTTTTAPPTGVSIPAGTEGWLTLVEAYFAPDDVQRALDVMWCESRGDADATNASSGAAGLYQHLPVFWEERSANAGFAGASIYDPTANTAVAAWLVYSGGGWHHWNPSAYCWG